MCFYHSFTLWKTVFTSTENCAGLLPVITKLVSSAYKLPLLLTCSYGLHYTSYKCTSVFLNNGSLLFIALKLSQMLVSPFTLFFFPYFCINCHFNKFAQLYPGDRGSIFFETLVYSYKTDGAMTLRTIIWVSRDNQYFFGHSCKVCSICILQAWAFVMGHWIVLTVSILSPTYVLKQL
jgi:hypothetical protein